MGTQTRAYGSVFLAGCLWGGIGLFLRPLAQAGLDALAVAAVRSAVAAIFYFVWLAVRDRAALRIRPRHCGYFFGTGICSLLFFNWCYFNAIQRSSMAVAAVLLYTAPAIVMLLSAVLFREAFTRRKAGALLLTLTGCALVTGLLPPTGEAVSLPTILFGLGAGAGYALYSVVGKFALRIYSPATVTFYTLVFAALGALCLRGLDWLPLLVADGTAIAGGLGMGLLCCLAPYLLYTAGLRRAEPGRAAIVATVEPVVAALVGAVAFHEALTPLRLLGMAVILGAVALLNTGPAPKEDG